MQAFIFYLVLVIGFINFIHLAFYIVGGDIYDIRALKHKKVTAATKKKQLKSPLVSIIIPAHNEEMAIKRCLDSIYISSYRKIEVIVHNDHSTDKTAAIIRTFIKKHPKFKLRLINRRKNVGKGAGVNYAIRTHAKGALIMTLDADCVLHKDAVKNTVRYFQDEKIIGIAANVRIMDSTTILGLLQKFEHMIGYRSKKFYTITNSEFIVGGVASTYRREVMELVNYYDTDTQTEDIGLSMKIVAQGNREQRIVYAADVLAMTEGVHTFKALLRQRYRWKLGMLQNLFKQIHLLGNRDKRYSKMLTFYRMPMAFLGEFMLLLEPLILVYILYMSVVYRTPMLFFGAYVTITLYVLWTIWPDEHSNFRRKLQLSSYAPIMYFVFYIMDIVQIAAIFRIIISPKKVIKRGGAGNWTSPERSGATAEFS
jgi:cellulose synthase/poly-beta-1,6-N-acetylglucosamine synthase-like glycosyltransferase